MEVRSPPSSPSLPSVPMSATQESSVSVNSTPLSERESKEASVASGSVSMEYELEETSEVVPLFNNSSIERVRHGANGKKIRRKEKAVINKKLLAISPRSQKVIQEEMGRPENPTSAPEIMRAGFVLPLFDARLGKGKNDSSTKEVKIMGQQSVRCPCKCEMECMCEEPPKTIFSIKNLTEAIMDMTKSARKTMLLPYLFCVILFVGCFAVAIAITLFIGLCCILPYKAYVFRSKIRSFMDMAFF